MFFFISFVVLLGGCGSRKHELLVLHAGSLSVPLAQISEAYMNRNPGIVILTEAAGSRTCARKINELNVPADVMASSDSAVIRQLLMPDYADFCIDFATNEMVIMYTENSREARRISVQNWPDILMETQVQYGHSDPNADPCGYRTLLCWQLAERHYNRPGLYRLLIDSRPLRNVRPKEVDLLALLDAGELDYIFIYKSVAEQHHGTYLELPDEINLKSLALAPVYEKVHVELTGAKPGETIVQRGAPMIYGITIPNTTRSPNLAAEFVAFIIGPEGQKIMEDNGQPVIVPAHVDFYDKLPAILKPLVKN